MCYNGTFRFKKLDDSFWNGETFRFADYIMSLCSRVSKQIKRNQSLYDQFARPLHKKLYIC